MKNRFHSLATRASRLFTPSVMAAALALGALPTTAQAGCNMKCAFRTVGSISKQTTDKGIKFASDQGRALATMTDDEFRWVKSSTTQLSTDSRAYMEAGYNQALTTVGSFMEDRLIRLLRARANSYLSQNNAAISTMFSRARNLSDQARAALKRIVKTMPTKQLTPLMKADMQLIAKEMGFYELSGKVINSSWGIGISSEAGVGPAGINAGLALVMDVNPNSRGGVNAAFVNSVGAATGIDLGLYHSVIMFWQPGTANDSTGLSIGWSASGGLLNVGGGIEIGFQVPTESKDYSSYMSAIRAGVTNSLVPSVGLAIDIPGGMPTEFEASYDVGVGYTQVIATFEINPTEICKFVTTAVNGMTQTKVASGSSCPGAASDSY